MLRWLHTDLPYGRWCAHRPHHRAHPGGLDPDGTCRNQHGEVVVEAEGKILVSSTK